VDAQGQVCDDAVPRSHRVLLEGSTLDFNFTCQRVNAASKAKATAASDAASRVGSASNACLLPATSSGLAEPVYAADHVVKTGLFPQICSFSVVSDRSFKESDCCGLHLRIFGDHALIRLGTEFGICSENAADCFGQVTSCYLASVKPTVAAEAFVYTLHLKVSRNVIYLPCNPQLLENGTWTEVFHVFAAKSVEIDAEIQRRTLRSVVSQHRSMQPEDLQKMTDLKRRAFHGIDAVVHLTQEELGAVFVRTGFLASQPLISACVRLLIVKWHPDTYEDECVRAFGSKNGPWDMFYVFDYLRKRNLHSSRNKRVSSPFMNLLKELGYLGAQDPVYNDRQQRRLEDIMERYSRRHGVV
jgi:hypothetical protein